jgi:hypothetical protein
VAASEDQPELVVVDGAARSARSSVVQEASLLLSVVALALASHPVDGFATGGGGQPGAGARRHAFVRPPHDGDRERLGCRLFGDVEVTEAPGEDGNDPRPLVAVGLGNRLPDVDLVHSARNGRTSISGCRLSTRRPPA